MRREVWQETFWPASLVLLILAFWIPLLDVQPYLTPGDMGRDLYAFQETLRGHWPCRDYWWQYGPLMPFYYAFWFLVGGVNLLSVRIGLGVVYLVTGVLAYRTLRLLASPSVAFLSALAFLNRDITWTFNHVGAYPFLLTGIFSLWKFFLTRRLRWCYFGALALAGMALVKLNVGLTAFAAFLAALGFDWGGSKFLDRNTPWKGKHLFFIGVIFSLLVAGSYLGIYSGLPFKWINQCFPLRPEYRVLAPPPWTNFKHLLLRFVEWEPSRLWWIGSFLGMAFLAWRGLKKESPAGSQKKVLFSAGGSLFLFGLAACVEYFGMEGMIYRFDFWLFPIFVLSMGLAGEWAGRLFPPPLKRILGVMIFLGVLVSPFQTLRAALADKTPERYLDVVRGRVYLGGPPAFSKTLKEGTEFIIQHTRPGEPILTIPYDILYCFLSSRRHAVKEMIFMEHAPFYPGEEQEMIQRIEKGKPPLVILSNRYRSSEKGVGEFGKTHCRELARYLSDRYQEVKTVGPWESFDGPHAIKILKRKDEGL